MPELRTEFVFKYMHGFRHLCPNYEKLNLPFTALESVGGIIATQRDFAGRDNVADGFSGEFVFRFREYGFIGSRLLAFCIQETPPRENANPPEDMADALTNRSPHYITRVRLGNYDFNDKITQEVIKSLEAIPQEIQEGGSRIAALL